jgi:hypothetical protein
MVMEREQTDTVRMKAPDRLYFARNEAGQVVDVNQVGRGLACACACLACGGPLVAKQGPKVVWHFAHAQPADQRSCGETALHLAAKAALLDLSTIQLPSVSWKLPSLHDSLGRELLVQARGPKQEVTVTTVELEVHRGTSVGDVRLDGLLSTSAGAIGVEVLVTHAVDDVKGAKLASLELPVVELDLSGYVQSCTSFDRLKTVLQHEAPRELVAGAEALFAKQVLAAKKDGDERLAAIEAALAKLTTMTPQERQREVELAKHAGVDLANPPTSLGCLKWLALGESDGIPERSFSGHPHRLWQLAVMVWLQGQRFGAKLSFSSMLHGVYKTLGIPGTRTDDAANADALRAWLGEFEWPGYELKYLYNDDHGWGEDWYQWRRDQSKSVQGPAAGSAGDAGQMALW